MRELSAADLVTQPRVRILEDGGNGAVQCIARIELGGGFRDSDNKKAFKAMLSASKFKLDPGIVAGIGSREFGLGNGQRHEAERPGRHRRLGAGATQSRHGARLSTVIRLREPGDIAGGHDDVNVTPGYPDIIPAVATFSREAVSELEPPTSTRRSNRTPAGWPPPVCPHESQNPHCWTLSLSSQLPKVVKYSRGCGGWVVFEGCNFRGQGLVFTSPGVRSVVRRQPPLLSSRASAWSQTVQTDSVA
jgi:hypothetical protein